VSEAQQRVAGCLDDVSLGAIALECVARLVGVPAVELDRNGVCVPDGVELVARNVRVRRGAGEVVGNEEWEELIFEI
jgi:hypothetical protein